MDEEGTDVHFIVHSGGTGHPDPEIEKEFIYAEHRYLNEFCGRDPHRLKTHLTVGPFDIDGSVAEIKRWGAQPWVVAIQPKLPIDYPIDHPDLHPIWAAAQDHGLAVVHHSLSSGYPGYRDMWSNPFLGRCASLGRYCLVLLAQVEWQPCCAGGGEWHGLGLAGGLLSKGRGAGHAGVSRGLNSRRAPQGCPRGFVGDEQGGRAGGRADFRISLGRRGQALVVDA